MMRLPNPLGHCGASFERVSQRGVASQADFRDGYQITYISADEFGDQSEL